MSQAEVRPDQEQRAPETLTCGQTALHNRNFAKYANINGAPRRSHAMTRRARRGRNQSGFV
jgi:hypothetical protein